VPPEIDSIAGTEVLPQFHDAIANRLAIAKIAGFDPLQANPDPGLGLLVAQRLKPFGDRFLAAGGLVSEDFNLSETVA